MDGMPLGEYLQATLSAPAICRDLGPDAVQFLGHRNRVGAKYLFMLAQIRIRDPYRAFDRLPNPVAKPVLDRDVEEQRSQNHREDCRNNRDDGKKPD